MTNEDKLYFKQITHIKKISSNNYQVYFDDGENLVIIRDTLIKYHLKINNSLNNIELEEIKRENIFFQGLNEAFKYLNKGMKTKLEVKRYLVRKGYDLFLIDKVISHLLTNNYINDYEYSEQWLKNKIKNKPIGRKKIRYILKKKGITDEIINTLLKSIENNNFIENVTKIYYDKWLKYLKNTDELNAKKKMLKFLLYKGFGYEEAMEIINEFNS